MNRRDFLKGAAAGAIGLTLGGCNDFWNDTGGDDELWGLNVHPYGGGLFTAQIQALREMRIKRIRISLGLYQDLAGPYLSAYPAEYVGLVDDFSAGYPDVARWPGIVRDVVSRAAGVSVFEILNEPDDLAPAVYVNSYLRPAYDVIKSINASYQVVAAAPSGTANGRLRFYEMLNAGADTYCDSRGVHLYSDNAEVYLAGTERPFLVTETGVALPSAHVDWWTTTMPRISGVLGTSGVYFYTLMDRPDTGFSIISSNTTGQVVALSPLYDHLRSL